MNEPKPYFPPLIVGGRPVDLSHLEPFTFHVQSLLARKNLRIRVLFSTHCFSTGRPETGHPVGDTVIDADRPVEHQRTFCANRYALSKSLPNIISGFVGVDVGLTTSKRNHVYVATVSGNQPYQIFFELRRASAERRTWQDLNLVIESAYIPDGSLAPTVKILPFALLAGLVHTRKA